MKNIRDIAQALGISVSTVSAALNGTWEARRIKKETAERIQNFAQEQGFTVNAQARALRTSNSGLIGLILPTHNNRFFSDIAQFFSFEARKRDLCPVTVSTDRKSEEEMDTVRDLVKYSIDALLVVGAAFPDEISAFCVQANLPHIFVDQPCPTAHSVVTDNYKGAFHLTELIAKNAKSGAGNAADRIYFFGGDSRLYASQQRVLGFKDALKSLGEGLDEGQVIAHSYEPEDAYRELMSLHERLGALPKGLLINSLTVFEGAMKYLSTLPEEELLGCSFGCFDYDPFIKFMRFPLQIVRQRHRQLILKAFDILESQEKSPQLIKIEPEFYVNMR